MRIFWYFVNSITEYPCCLGLHNALRLSNLKVPILKDNYAKYYQKKMITVHMDIFAPVVSVRI